MLVILGVPVYPVTVSAFDRLERTHVGREAEELRIAISAHAQRLRDFGVTHSIWTALHHDLAAADARQFAIDLPPGRADRRVRHLRRGGGRPARPDPGRRA